jgi:hypothetical protein
MMCLFSADESQGVTVQVATTRIFARADGARQWLAYSMRLATAGDVAMILPLPVPPGSPEDAASFVDLSGYAALFDHLDRCMFGSDDDPADDLLCLSSADGEPLLRVHDVGAFEASYVPSLAAFSRLDPRFRLPASVWAQLTEYGDWGFAVFKFRPGEHRVHPLGLQFPRRWTDRIFFPTVHVHDGALHDEADYDHMLYYQGMTRPERHGAASQRAGWTYARHATTRFVDVAAARGLVDGAQPIERLRYFGTRPNEDVWLTPAPTIP